jgi:hypothetical protein
LVALPVVDVSMVTGEVAAAFVAGARPALTGCPLVPAKEVVQAGGGVPDTVTGFVEVVVNEVYVTVLVGGVKVTTDVEVWVVVRYSSEGKTRMLPAMTAAATRIEAAMYA